MDEDASEPTPLADAPTSGNANWVLLWFLVPLVLVFVWQVFWGGDP